MHVGQGWPAMPIDRAGQRSYLKLLRGRTEEPGNEAREGINRGQSSSTWKQQQLDYIFF